MEPCTHAGIKRLFCLKAKNALGRFAPSALSHYKFATPVASLRTGRPIYDTGAAARICGIVARRNCRLRSTSRDVNEAKAASYLQQAVCVRRKKKSKKQNKIKFAPPKTHYEILSNRATATTPRRRAKNHVPRVSPYSPASLDTGFVEIGLAQLSQSVKTTNVTHTDTDGQTN